MLAYCGECAVMFFHDIEPFHKGGLMALGCHSTFEERAESLVCILEFKSLFLCFLHDSDTPIHIGRIFVVEIIGYLSCKVGSCIESLMTYQHSFLETLPREDLWRGKSAFTYEMPVIVNDVGITIDNSWQVFSLQLLCNASQGVFFVKHITGIKEDDVISLSELYALVHSIIQTFVRFALDNDRIARVVCVCLSFLHGVIA